MKNPLYTYHFKDLIFLIFYPPRHMRAKHNIHNTHIFSILREFFNLYKDQGLHIKNIQ